jgi:hypothetical protein
MSIISFSVAIFPQSGNASCDVGALVEVSRCDTIRRVPQIVLAHLGPVFQENVNTIIVAEKLSHLSCECLSLILILVEPMTYISIAGTQRIFVSLDGKYILMEALQLRAYILHWQSVSI